MQRGQLVTPLSVQPLCAGDGLMELAQSHLAAQLRSVTMASQLPAALQAVALWCGRVGDLVDEVQQLGAAGGSVRLQKTSTQQCKAILEFCSYAAMRKFSVELSIGCV